MLRFVAVQCDIEDDKYWDVEDRFYKQLKTPCKLIGPISESAAKEIARILNKEMVEQLKAATPKQQLRFLRLFEVNK
jgi:hypothetical protein